jgi:general secretion pathway protein G
VISAHYRRGVWKSAYSLDRRVGGVFAWWGGTSPRKLEYALRPSVTRNHICRDNKSHGFTLIEILIAMAILVTISALAIPHLISAIDQANLAKAVGDIHSIETDIVGYQSTTGQLPDDLSQVGDDTILDPWGNPYQYLNHATLHGNGHVRKDRFLVPLNSDYDLYSMGKDGQTAQPITAAKSQDDVIRVGSANYIGLASQF